ncbi:MAG: GcrA family cell cycle regulator [Pseudomonadota bacterium]
MPWSDERVYLLKRMWGEGRTAAQIAKELGGVTRNAVIGKAHRLGLSKNRDRKRILKSTPEPKLESPQPAPKKHEVPTTKPPEPTPARRKIVLADKHLPPQPSPDDFRPEALASQRTVQKNALRLSLMELTERTCKWPFGDPASEDFWFCGLPVEPGKPYCKACLEVAYQPASRSRRR